MYMKRTHGESLRPAASSALPSFFCVVVVVVVVLLLQPAALTSRGPDSRRSVRDGEFLRGTTLKEHF